MAEALNKDSLTRASIEGFCHYTIQFSKNVSDQAEKLPKDNNTPTQLPLLEPSLGFGFSQEEPFYRFVVSESEAQFTVISPIAQVFF
jgi:hypothetical protein